MKRLRERHRPEPTLGDFVKAWFGLFALASLAVVAKVLINLLTR